MAKFTRGDDGKFTGSVGSGKTRVPTASQVSAGPSTASSVDSAPAAPAAVYAAWKGSRPAAVMDARQAHAEAADVRRTVLALWSDGRLAHTWSGIETMEASAEAVHAADALIADPTAPGAFAARQALIAAYERMWLVSRLQSGENADWDVREGFSRLRTEIGIAMSRMRDAVAATPMSSEIAGFVDTRARARRQGVRT